MTLGCNYSTSLFNWRASSSFLTSNYHQFTAVFSSNTFDVEKLRKRRSSWITLRDSSASILEQTGLVPTSTSSLSYVLQLDQICVISTLFMFSYISSNVVCGFMSWFGYTVTFTRVEALSTWSFKQVIVTAIDGYLVSPLVNSLQPSQ